MGASGSSNNNRSTGSTSANYTSIQIQGPSIYVDHVVPMDLTTRNMGLKYLGAVPSYFKSPSDCTSLSTLSTVSATPLDQKHRYHLFFAYHPSDEQWVIEIVGKLEDDPYNYKCCLAKRDFDDKLTHLQNILCSTMLSQRIIVVISPRFINELWPEYEDNIVQLTSLNQLRQRVVPVVLEKCSIPESLTICQPVEVDKEGFLEAFCCALQVDGFPFSESMLTIQSLGKQTTGYQNGQVLSSVQATIEGFCKARLVLDYDDIPDITANNESVLSREEHIEVIRTVGLEGFGRHMSWLFSAVPTILLGIVFVMWCVAFVLVILLYPDNKESTLLVRLCVFAIPAVAIVFGSILRWKKLKDAKEYFAMCIFSRSVQINKKLFEKNKNVIVTTARRPDDSFHEHVKTLLDKVSDDEIVKLNKLVDIYTLTTTYIEDRPMATRIAVMMSAAFAANFLYKRLPNTLDQRHTQRHQCLCQYIEEFLVAYLPSLKKQGGHRYLRSILTKYLNCQPKTDISVLRSLGMS